MYTLTTRDIDGEILTALHADKAAAIESLRVNYDLAEGLDEGDIIEYVAEAGTAVYLTEHKVEVLVIRDPDDYTEVEVYVNGKEAMFSAYEVIDPGAGYPLSQWVENTGAVAANEDYSPAFRDRVVSVRQEYNESQYVVPDGQEEE